MNSIATMPKTTPVPTRYSLALSAAIKDSKLTKALIAEHMDVSPGFVSQWASGLRTVPPEKASRLGDLLTIEPSNISPKFAQHWASPGNVVPIRNDDSADQRRPELIIARLENDIDSLRFAVGALVAAMTTHRPIEAVDVAKSIRKSVPKKFVRQGYLHELLQALDKA
jgi:transcriptional regulator with XRE-family HTH domain